MYDTESKFLETQSLQPLTWFRYIDDVLFIWTHGKEKLQLFLTSLNNYNPLVKFTYGLNKEHISFLHLKAQRLSRICSYTNDFKKYLVDTKSWFQVRGYPDNLLKKRIG